MSLTRDFETWNRPRTYLFECPGPSSQGSRGSRHPVLRSKPQRGTRPWGWGDQDSSGGASPMIDYTWLTISS